MDQLKLTKGLTNRKLTTLAPFLQEGFLKQIRHGDLPRWLDLIQSLPAIEKPVVKTEAVVSIGDAQACDQQTLEEILQGLKNFIPWRKGPFSLFGIYIDSEWNSAMKWDRLLPHISSLAGRSVLDVGCGNAYYGYRMIDAGADLVIGLEPHIPYVMQFKILQRYSEDLPLHVAPVTLDQLPKSIKAFDTVFSMGVLYHRRSPIDHLMQLKSCLRPGGELVLETLFVDGDKGYSLTPEDRYARMSNVWFIPSIDTLVSWLDRCGFSGIQVANKCSTTPAEQRKTAWMPFRSLEDAISKNSDKLTIEGLPAPKRVIVVAQAPN